MAELNLEITTPEKIVYSGNAKSVTVPGTKGGFEVLVNHAPILSTLEIGSIKIVTEDVTKYCTTSGGTIEVVNNKILILSDAVEMIDDIDIERVKSAKERAVKRLSDKENKDIDKDRALAAKKRAENRLKVVEMHLRTKA